jgi:hypothetical protein
MKLIQHGSRFRCNRSMNNGVASGMVVAPWWAMAKSRKKGNGVPPQLAAAPQMAGDTTAATLDREHVARRAYELYQARGGGDGMAMEDWLAAERECSQPKGRSDD